MTICHMLIYIYVCLYFEARRTLFLMVYFFSRSTPPQEGQETWDMPQNGLQILGEMMINHEVWGVPADQTTPAIIHRHCHPRIIHKQQVASSCIYWIRLEDGWFLKQHKSFNKQIPCLFVDDHGCCNPLQVNHSQKVWIPYRMGPPQWCERWFINPMKAIVIWFVISTT
jgi:hypothetical protein